jgi:hypothetical protein
MSYRSDLPAGAVSRTVKVGLRGVLAEVKESAAASINQSLHNSVWG